MWIVLSKDPYEVQDWLADTKGTDASFDVDFTDAICIHIGTTSYIWFDSDRIDVPTIVHELCHATFDMMKDVGLDIHDQEAFCYIIGYLVEQCSNIFAIQMEVSNLQLEKVDKEDEQVSS